MTKLKKGLIVACTALTIAAAGAGVGFAPISHAAYALEGPVNYWKEIPQINSWVWGSFSWEKNGFTALPTEDYTGDVEFKFSKADTPDTEVFTVYEQLVEGKHSFWYIPPNYSNHLTDTEPIEGRMNAFGAGDYIMEVSADPLLNLGDYTHSATLRFSVEKAENYWVEVPYIKSWYQREWTDAKDFMDFHMPTAKAKYDETGKSIEYTIYPATADGEINLNAEPLFEGSNNPDFGIKENHRLALSTAPAGTYFLVACVKETENYTELYSEIPFRIFPSDAALAALEAAKAEWEVELTRFIEWNNPFGENLHVDWKNNPEVQADYNRLESANTVFDVQDSMERAKLTVSKIYARAKIEEEARNFYEEIGDKLDIDWLKNVWLKDEFNSIDNADNITTVKNNLESAFQAIYRERLGVARKNAGIELSDYAKKAGVEGYESVQFTEANTIEEVNEMLAEKKHEVDLKALEEITELEAYKEQTIQALIHYANYIGFDFTREEDLLHSSEIREANTKDKVNEAYGRVKRDIDAEFVRTKTQLLLDLQKLAQNYVAKYPESRDDLSKIISLDSSNLLAASDAQKEMLPADDKDATVFTMSKAREVYEKYYSEIKKKVFSHAQKQALKDLGKAADEANVPNFDRTPYQKAIEEATTVDEVEEALELARYELGRELSTARTEMLREFDEFAAEYFTSENYVILIHSLDSGKASIYNATSLSGIYTAGKEAKIAFLRVYVNFELNRYADVYADFGINFILERQRSRITGSSSSTAALLLLLTEAQEQIFDVAKSIGAEEGFKKQIADPFYPLPNFAYSNALTAVKATENLDELYKVYTDWLKELNELRDAVSLARRTLELYAEGYGLKVGVGTKAQEAIDGIYAAATPDDLPELVKVAKAKIDVVAEKAQKRIDGVNSGLIASTVIFAAMVIGFAVLMIVLQMRKSKKKNEAIESEGANENNQNLNS